VAAGGVLRGPTPGRNNSSANVDAMGVRSGRDAAEDRSSNVLHSNSSDRRNNNRPLRKPRESGPDAVAGAGAVAADQKNPLLRIKTHRPSSRGFRVSRDYLVHHKHRAPIRRNHPKKAELLVPREMVRNDGDVSAGVAVVGAVVVRRARRHNCGFAALSVVGWLRRVVKD
jgi:hypothetical protein